MRVAPDASAELVRELVGTQCRCGRPEETAADVLHAVLFHAQRFGSGYEEAYAAAIAFLDRHPPPAA